MTDSIPQVVREARRLTRSRARSFYLASLFLPACVRSDVYVVYAFYRTIDDLVDEAPPGTSKAEIAAELDRWQAVLSGEDCGHDPFTTALQSVVERHNIPLERLRMILAGARRDLDFRPFETMDQLIDYSILVAGSVGMVMAHILGSSDERSIQAACDLGVAMQLTNILRDVSEDLERNRVYLPRQELSAAGLGVLDLYSGVVVPPLRGVLESVAAEARCRYAAAAYGIERLDPSVRFAITLAAGLYAKILDKIERQNFDVFAGRAHLGAMEKWMLAMPAYLQHRALSRR